MGWTIYLVSNFISLWRWEAVWGHEMTGKGAALPPGLALINWGTCVICRALCSKVGFHFIISKSQCLAWLPCCNSSSFSRLLAHIAVSFPKISLERRVFSAFLLLEVTLWAMMWWRCTTDKHPHMHLPGFMFRNCAQKFVNYVEHRVAYVENRVWDLQRTNLWNDQ